MKPKKGDVFVDPEGKRFRFDRFYALNENVAICKDSNGKEVMFIWKHADGENTFYKRADGQT